MITKPPLSPYSEPWSFIENKQFEACLAEGYLDIEDESTRWLQIAQRLGGKRTPAEIKNHYCKLAYDVESIESGRVPLPSYSGLYNSDDNSEDDDSKDDDLKDDKSCKSSARPKKQGFQWSIEEHRLFLVGLKYYTKSDWKSIARDFVVTRSPTQVASHAQKYFDRNDPENIKKRKRSSIHDITVNDDAALQKLHKKGLLPTHIFDKLRSKSHVEQPPAGIEIKQEHSNEQVNNNNNSISPNYQLQMPQVVHYCEQVNNNNNSISPNYQVQTPQVVHCEQVSNSISQSQYQPRPPPLPHHC
ncbi:transcription factor SRM1-like [Beta vulgaris subsp. vulgaris]|uniref:transcription factor SRM1-like n=1 Tax=Beta vulgaris subsp. vulgaris TaxID=3555 RepID=UPI0005402500|nr:transcription factor SRM1-like [Beta vulgaris subsp. vulgaris]